MMPRTAEHIRLALELNTALMLISAWWVMRRKTRKIEDSHLDYAREHEEQLQQKDLLIREVHHRVANQMGLTAALLHLQASRSVHPDAKASLFESENRIRTLSKLHARLHHPDFHRQISLFPYLSELVQDLISTLRPDLEYCPVYCCKSPSTTSTTAVTCGLLVHELITNCIKHAFPQQRKGAISFTLNCPPPDRLRISIQDNGIGLPPDFSMQDPSTSGMAIISALTKDLAGTFTATPREPGVEFIVEFPLSNLERVL